MRLDILFAAVLVGGFMLSFSTAFAYDAEFDYNADGVVDQADLDLLSAHFNSVDGDDLYQVMFDHDGDGYIGGTDYVAAMSAVSNQ